MAVLVVVGVVMVLMAIVKIVLERRGIDTSPSDPDWYDVKRDKSRSDSHDRMHDD